MNLKRPFRRRCTCHIFAGSAQITFTFTVGIDHDFIYLVFPGWLQRIKVLSGSLLIRMRSLILSCRWILLGLIRISRFQKRSATKDLIIISVSSGENFLLIIIPPGLWREPLGLVFVGIRLIYTRYTSSTRILASMPSVVVPYP
jgi:hypothetical protein